MKANDFTAVKAMLTQGANPNAKVGKKGKANPSPTFLFLSATLNLIPIKPLSPFRPARPPAGTRIGMTAMHRVAKVGNRKLELILEDYGGVKISGRLSFSRPAKYPPPPVSGSPLRHVQP